jgi:WD40 repeat protein
LASGSWDKSIKLWSVESLKEVATLQGHSNYVSSVAFSSDSKYLASGSMDFSIKVWNVALL